jgi:Thiol:disulfide interchange protein DsbD, N-terminal
MKQASYKILTALLLLLTCAASQERLGAKGPSVTLAPPGLITATRGKPTEVSLHFRISQGYHINSNAPHSEFLIPTALKMDVPTDIVIGKIAYPEGRDMSFPFSPDEKISVYSGDFTVSMVVRPLHTVVPAKYALHGFLRYQACDNAQCYPKKELPVNFEVKVVKGPPPVAAHNPAQSPHAHR